MTDTTYATATGAPVLPATKPARPFFSSGPCAKPPGWSADKLATDSLGRSHRSKIGKTRLQYSIDLMRTRYMHWWKFNLLLGTISGDCELKERIRYRSINVVKIKDAAERRRIRKIQAQIALPRNEPLSDEEIASVF